MAKRTRVRAAGVGVAALVLALGVAFLAAADLVSSQGGGPTVSMEAGAVPEGGIEVTRLSALDVSSPALCGFTIDVSYDRLVKLALDCDADPENKFAVDLCNVDYASDTVRVVGAAVPPGGVTGNIPLMDITWCAVGSADESTDLDVQIVSFTDCQIPPVEITSVADQDGVNVIVSGSPPFDSDGDGFDDCVEMYVGTDTLDACPDDPNDDAWPADFNMDTYVNVLDLILYRGHIPSQVSDPSYASRFDLNADGAIDLLDLLMLRPVILTSCTP